MYGMYAACVSENKLFSEIIKKKSLEWEVGDMKKGRREKKGMGSC